MSEMKKLDPTAELISKIEEDIRKSGFPLELHVLNVCSSKNTGRLPSLRYEHQNQIREIDLVTNFETIKLKARKGGAPQHTSTALIIECKKSASKPWVFFSSRSYAFQDVLLHYCNYVSDFDRYFSANRGIPLLPRIYPRLRNFPYANSGLKKCIGYNEAFRDKDKPSDIYKAVDSVLTYLSHRKESRGKRREKFGIFTEFFLPVIVLDGRLFEASLDNDKLKVKEQHHLQLRTLHQNDIYIIDVVTKDHFRQFFNEVEGFHKGLVSSISSLDFPESFVAEATSRIDAVQNSADEDGSLSMIFADSERVSVSKKNSTRRVKK
jgi:hypothetical protein